MTRDELLALPTTVDVPTAGRAYGLGRRTSYELARVGDFPVPVMRLGERVLRVRSADLVADLLARDSSEAGASTPATAPTDPTTAKLQVSP